MDILTPLVKQGYDQKLTLQILNVIGFFIAMLLNGLSPVIMPQSLTEITDNIGALIEPDGYAFAIWGLIYSLLGVFTVYQALPSSWVPSRNDQLIYYDIGYVFFANMIINGVWLIIFQTYTGAGMILGLLDIALMLASNLYIKMVSNRTSVNIPEWIGLRAGFSIYSGWVTAATILNATFLLKFFGVDDLGPINEEQATVGILYIAFFIYNLASYSELNPLLGSVFIWVVTAIRSNIMNNKPEYTLLKEQTEYIALAQTLSMTLLWSFTGTTSVYDIDTGFNRGLLY